MNWLIASSALMLLSSLCTATTYVIDDSGGAGVDFTDLQTAINAAAAGDVLLVRAGGYGVFALDKSLTIVADDGATVGLPYGTKSTITNLAVGARVIVSGLDVRGLQMSQCTGSVALDDMAFLSGGSAPVVRVQNCADVRFHRCVVFGTMSQFSGSGALSVSGSRVELAECSVIGTDGEDDDNNGDYGPDGGYGVRCDLGSRVHFALTSVEGGDGGDACSGLCPAGYGGNGAAAIQVMGGSTAIVAGVASNSIKGGNLGHGNFPGTRASGIEVHTGSFLRWSSVTIAGGGSAFGAPPPIALMGGTAQQASPRDPTLGIAGSAVPGGTVTLTFHGLSGTNGRLQQGNQMLVDDDGLAGIEKLDNRIRIHPLGPVPASGTITYPLIVPTNWVPGQFRVFQGLEIDTATAMLIERTNSVPVVVH